MIDLIWGDLGISIDFRQPADKADRNGTGMNQKHRPGLATVPILVSGDDNPSVAPHIEHRKIRIN